MSNICKDLRLAILQSAFQGKLTKQLSEDGKAKDLLDRIKQAQEESGEKLKEALPVGDDDQLFAIPDSWYWVRIGDIFNHNTGKTKNAAQNTTGESRKYITTSNMYWNSFDFSKVGKMNFKEEELEKYTVKKGDILVCEGGDFGRTAIWDYDEEVCFQNHIHRLRFFYPLNTNFFYWLFFFYKNANLIKGKGIGIQGLSSSALHNIAFPLPPLAEQERIVKKIDELMARVADLEQLADALASLKKAFPDDIKASLLQAAMQGKLTKQLLEDGSAEDLLEEIKAEKEKLIAEGKIKRQKPLAPITDDEIPFNIPENWKWERFGNLGSYRKGPFGSALTKSIFIKDSANAIKVYEQKNAIKKDTSLGDYFISREYYEGKMKNFRVLPGDIIVSCAGTIGETFILPEGIREGIINQALMRMRMFNGIYIPYFLIYFDYIIKASAISNSKGSAIKNIPPFEVLYMYPVAIPPLAEQKRIVERLNTFMQNINVVGDLIASE